MHHLVDPMSHQSFMLDIDTVVLMFGTSFAGKASIYLPIPNAVVILTMRALAQCL